MNREIKFRAWDKNKKEVREVTGINWYDEYMWVDETPMSGDKLPIADTPLMQFTGLTDKNGKEIYEGDIVRDVGGFNVEVRWENGREGYVPFSIGRGERNPNDCEVIGNVFEDSNLLKETK